MRTFTLGLMISFLVGAAAACQGDSDDRDGEEPAQASPLSRLVPQVKPPIDIKAPPEDAARTASGLAVKKLTTREGGAQARRGDTVMVHYTGWRQRTGETFFTTKGIGQPLSLDIEHSAPAFSEALQLLHKGEKAVLWVPATESAPEPLVYEIEVTEVVSPPQVAKKGTVTDGDQSKVVGSTGGDPGTARAAAAPARSTDAPGRSDAPASTR
jgi:hypothetical protein